jgi:hypothetical protein
MLTLPSPSRWTIVPPNASWWFSSAPTYRSRLFNARRSSACISAVYATMSVNITATIRRSSPSLISRLTLLRTRHFMGFQVLYSRRTSTSSSRRAGIASQRRIHYS